MMIRTLRFSSGDETRQIDDYIKEGFICCRLRDEKKKTTNGGVCVDLICECDNKKF